MTLALAVVGDFLPVEPTVLFAVLVTIALAGVIVFFVLLAFEPYLPSLSLGTVDERTTREGYSETERSTNGGVRPDQPAGRNENGE